MKKFILVISIAIILPLGMFRFFLNSTSNQEKNGQVTTISIPSEAIQKEIKRTQQFYKFSNQNLKNYPSLEEDAKKTVVENTIIQSYADSHNIKVYNKEVDERYMQKTQNGGEEKLLLELSKMYGMDKNDYLEVLYRDILREKVQKDIGKPLSPWIKDQEKDLKILIN
jgi:FKBP-type peptidyl-prolyl cis-trans isomerase (trigger factor)